MVKYPKLPWADTQPHEFPENGLASSSGASLQDGLQVVSSPAVATTAEGAPRVPEKLRPLSLITAWKKIVTAAAPTALSFTATTLSNTAAFWFIGRNTTELIQAGHGLGYSIGNMLMLTVGMGLVNGIDTLSPLAIGRGEPFRCWGHLFQALAVLVLSMPFLLPMVLFAEQLLRLCGQDPITARIAGKYLRVALPGLISVSTFEALRKFLVFHGRQRFQSVMSFITLPVQLSFLFLFVSRLQLGAVGAALARSFTWVFTLLMSVIYIIHQRNSLHWKRFGAPYHIHPNPLLELNVTTSAPLAAERPQVNDCVDAASQKIRLCESISQPTGVCFSTSHSSATICQPTKHCVSPAQSIPSEAPRGSPNKLQLLSVDPPCEQLVQFSTLPSSYIMQQPNQDLENSGDTSNHRHRRHHHYKCFHSRSSECGTATGSSSSSSSQICSPAAAESHLLNAVKQLNHRPSTPSRISTETKCNRLTPQASEKLHEQQEMQNSTTQIAPPLPHKKSNESTNIPPRPHKLLSHRFWFSRVVCIPRPTANPSVAVTEPADHRRWWRGIPRFLRIAIPSALMCVIEWVSFELLIFQAAYLGAKELAALAASASLCSLIFVVSLSTSVIVNREAGRSLGARRARDAKTFAKAGMLVSIMTTLPIGTTVFLLRRSIAKLYSQTLAVRKVIEANLVPSSVMIMMDSMHIILGGVVKALNLQCYGAVIDAVGLLGVMQTAGILLAYRTPLKGRGFIVGTIIGLISVVSCYCTGLFAWVDWRVPSAFSNPELSRENSQGKVERKKVVEENRLPCVVSNPEDRDLLVRAASASGSSPTKKILDVSHPHNHCGSCGTGNCGCLRQAPSDLAAETSSGIHDLQAAVRHAKAVNSDSPSDISLELHLTTLHYDSEQLCNESESSWSSNSAREDQPRELPVGSFAIGMASTASSVRTVAAP